LYFKIVDGIYGRHDQFSAYKLDGYQVRLTAVKPNLF
jgi:hypothetical protein